MAERRWLVGYAVASFLAFPHPLAGRVLDLGLLLAFVAPACLLRGIAGLAPGRAALWGFAASLLAHTAILHWIWIVSVVYGHAHPVVGVLGPLGLGAYIACFGAAFCAGAALLARGRLDSPWALAALWTVLDYLRSMLLTGFPWATLGYAQHQNGALMGIVPFTGVYGLSFVAVLGGAVLARAPGEWRRARRLAPATATALGLVAAAHGVGAWLGASAPEPRGPTLRVAVLQGNVDQGVKWSADWYDLTLALYVDLSRRAAEQGAEVIVWPETAVPGAALEDPAQTEAFLALARETGALLVVGAVGLDPRPGRPPAVYDSAFLLSPEAGLVTRYDKSHLVPFGEYVPFQALLGHVFEAVARGIADFGVTPGSGPRALALETSAGPLTAGVAICYELLFPDLVRRFVRDGAEMLFAITNDAWYGRTGAPYQFLAITAMRSAENRVWTARAANTGVSAIIDSRGRVRARTRIFERDWLVADVPRMPPPAGGSFYARHGDLFAGACGLGVLGLLVLARRTQRDE